MKHWPILIIFSMWH